jgi:RNA polymerase sigma-70 factor, ECF subfamily
MLTEAMPPERDRSREGENPDDPTLLAAIVRGEREALGQLYDRHAGVLLAVAVRIVGDHAQAEDLLHDVVLEAWHRARDFDPGRGTVRAWLVTRMRSRALDRRAATIRQARLAEQVGRDAEPQASTIAARPDGDRMRRHLQGLPADLAEVVEMAYFDGLSFSDIARQLGIPIGTVKSRMARALQVLRERLAGGKGGHS